MMEQTKDELTYRSSERYYTVSTPSSLTDYYTALDYLYICVERSYPYLEALKFFVIEIFQTMFSINNSYIELSYILLINNQKFKS